MAAALRVLTRALRILLALIVSAFVRRPKPIIQIWDNAVIIILFKKMEKGFDLFIF